MSERSDEAIAAPAPRSTRTPRRAASSAEGFRPPLSTSRPALLRGGSDAAFRHFVSDLLTVAERMRATRDHLARIAGVTGPQYTMLMAIAQLERAHPAATGVRLSAVADYLRVSRAFVEPMIARGAGRIVNVASDAGRVGSLGETVYSAAKGGAIAFTKSLAREVARYNVTVNCVCPGPTDTPLMAAVPDKIKEAFTRVTPMRRLAKASEIADAILFFASGRASFVTGQVLSVSGGLTMAG